MEFIDKIREKLKEMSYNEIDEEILKLYCENIEIARLAKEHIDLVGITISTKDGIRQNPSLKTYKECCSTVERLGKILGITAYGRKHTNQAVTDALNTDELF
jgi:P27 family predicted phage terminase small subunit